MLNRPRTINGEFDHFLAEPVTLGPMASFLWRKNPARLLFSFGRYYFVAKTLKGKKSVAEVGCADAWCSALVRQQVGALDLYDIDPVWREVTMQPIEPHDIVVSPLPKKYDAVYLLDVIEHIEPKDELRAMANLTQSLNRHGVLVIGAPTLESQKLSDPLARTGHVNCKSGEQFRADAMRFFGNVFLYGMNDATLHTGHPEMAHYHFIVCSGTSR